jgi:hypothetical protein
MPAKPERARRKQLKRAVAAEDRAVRRARLQLSRAQLEALIDYVAGKLDETGGCDHTPRHAATWLVEVAGFEDEAAIERIVDALLDEGARCDCEVVLNLDPEDLFGPEGNERARRR